METWQKGLYPKCTNITNINNDRKTQDYFFKDIVSFSHIIGTISSIITDYIRSAFGDKYIKTVWNSMEEPFSQRGHKFRDILTKPRPLMTLEPKFDPSDNSLFFPQDEFDMYVSNDPTNDIWISARNSDPLIFGENFTLFHKLRRFKMDFNINFIFDSDMQRIQAQEYIRLNIRHKVPIMIHRYIENNIPDSFMNLISMITGIEKDNNHGFFRYLNERCNGGGTITRRLRTGTGNMEYFNMQYTPIEILFNDNPISNGPVKRGNIDISSSFSESVTVEFVMDTMFLLKTLVNIDELFQEKKNEIVGELQNEDLNDTLVPLGVTYHQYTTIDVPVVPKIENRSIKINTIAIQADKNGTDKINLFSLLNGEIGNLIYSYKKSNKPIDFFHISVIETPDNYLDGTRIIFDPETMDLTIKDMDIYKTYYVTLYINRDKLSKEQLEAFETDKFDYKGGE